MSEPLLIEAMGLQGSRMMITTAKQRIEGIAWDSERREATNLGRLLEALEAADDALFNVLNVASSRCSCPEASKAIDFALGRVTRDDALVAEAIDSDPPEPQSLRA